MKPKKDAPKSDAEFAQRLLEHLTRHRVPFEVAWRRAAKYYKVGRA